MSKASLLELCHGEKKYEIVNKQENFYQLNICAFTKMSLQMVIPYIEH